MLSNHPISGNTPKFYDVGLGETVSIKIYLQNVRDVNKITVINAAKYSISKKCQ